MSGLKEAMNTVRANPKQAGAWVALGEILLAEHQLEKATQSFQRALQLEPMNSAAQRGLAQILLAGKDGASPTATTSTRPTPQARPTPRSSAPTPPVAEPRTRASAPPTSRDAAPPRTPTPFVRESEMSRPQRGVAAPMELRTPPPRARKPTQARVTFGLFFIGLIPLLCLCVLVLALAKVL